MRPAIRIVLLLGCALTHAAALAARDPLELPAAARAAQPASAGGAGTSAAGDPVIRHLVTVDGRRWVLDGARRLGVGDTLGTLRIECIHDDGVTVRDDTGARRRLPLFGGVVIRPSAGSPPRPVDCPAPASKNPKRSSR